MGAQSGSAASERSEESVRAGVAAFAFGGDGRDDMRSSRAPRGSSAVSGVLGAAGAAMHGVVSVAVVGAADAAVGVLRRGRGDGVGPHALSYALAGLPNAVGVATLLSRGDSTPGADSERSVRLRQAEKGAHNPAHVRTQALHHARRLREQVRTLAAAVGLGRLRLCAARHARRKSAALSARVSRTGSTTICGSPACHAPAGRGAAFSSRPGDFQAAGPHSLATGRTGEARFDVSASACTGVQLRRATGATDSSLPGVAAAAGAGAGSGDATCLSACVTSAALWRAVSGRTGDGGDSVACSSCLKQALASHLFMAASQQKHTAQGERRSS